MLDSRGHWIGPDEWFLEEDAKKQAEAAEKPAKAAAAPPVPPATEKIAARTDAPATKPTAR